MKNILFILDNLDYINTYKTPFYKFYTYNNPKKNIENITDISKIINKSF